METVIERSVSFRAPLGKVSKDLEVFYNPVMQFNRDLSVLVLLALEREGMQIGLPLSGTGVRGLRLYKELPRKMVKSIEMNDYDANFIKNMNANLKLNSIKSKVKLHDLDANDFLLNSKGFDYIDVDPFGSPNPFLDSAVKRLARNGVLAVTATDTSALAGTYIGACKRKYWAVPIRNHLKHEMGLRILIRKVQLIGAQYEKALVPLISVSKDHYYKIFFINKKGKKEVDKLVNLHSMTESNKQLFGPVYMGPIHDSKFVGKMLKKLKETCFDEKEIRKILEVIYSESKSKMVGFHDLHDVCKRHSIGDILKTSELTKMLDSKKIKYHKTHTTPLGIKCDITEDKLVKLIKNRKTFNFS